MQLWCFVALGAHMDGHFGSPEAFASAEGGGGSFPGYVWGGFGRLQEWS